MDKEEFQNELNPALGAFFVENENSKLGENCVYNGNILVYEVQRRTLEEAVFVWQKKHGFLRKANNILICVIVCFLVTLFGFLSMYFEKDFNLFGTLMFCTLECVVFCCYIVISLKNKLVTRLIQSEKSRLKLSSNFARAELLDDSLLIVTDYKKRAYAYSQIISILEIDDALVLVYDKYCFPIVISKVNVCCGDFEEFYGILRNKIHVASERM